MTEEAWLDVPGGGSLPEGQTVVVPLHFRGQPREAFLLRHEGQLVAYLNECPHWAIELDLGDGHFFDEELQRIYCKNHGALFHPASGICETGPCLGRGLTRLGVRQEGELVSILPREVVP